MKTLTFNHIIGLLTMSNNLTFIMSNNSQFRQIRKSAASDRRGRVTIGSSAIDKKYRIYENDHGQVLLDPLVEISERELSLIENQREKAVWDKAVKDVEIGKLVDRGSFTEYVD